MSRICPSCRDLREACCEPLGFYPFFPKSSAAGTYPNHETLMQLFDDMTPSQHLAKLKYILLGLDFHARQGASDEVTARNMRSLLRQNREYFDLSNYGTKDSIPERRDRYTRRNWATW